LSSTGNTQQWRKAELQHRRKRLKDLEEENTRLKKMYADLAMDNHILKDLFTKKGWALPPKGN
jgi:predicted nuclease with TOPRIM domain